MQWQSSFLSTVFYENMLLPNSYNINIDFECKSEDYFIQKTGFDRMQHFVYRMLQDSVMACTTNKLAVNLMKNTQSNWLLLPTEPDDQSLLWLVYTKLIAITTPYFQIFSVSMNSVQNDNIVFELNLEDALPDWVNEDWQVDENTKVSPWWMRPDTALYDASLIENKQLKVFTGNHTWEELGLNWVTEEDFKKLTKKNKAAKIIKPKKFQLKVLDGSKNANK